MALAICGDRSAAELRAYARRAPSPRAAARAYALANALEGMTRAEAARLAGLEDRPKPGRPPGLSEGEQAALAAIILHGPDPKRDGISAYTREDLARIIAERFGRRYHPSSLSGVLRRMGFSRQKTQPSHPRSDPAAQARWVKRGSLTR